MGGGKIMYKKLIVTIIIGTVLIFGSFLANLAQANTYEFNDILIKSQKNWLKDNPDSLPIHMTPEEELRIDEIGKGFQPTDAPPAPIRQPAEFEPMGGALIRYPFGISYGIIAEMSEDVEVVTIVASESQRNYVINQYQTYGVNLDHCSFLIAPTDSYWTRDYGPWFIFNGNDEQGIVDFIYNRPRPHDDQIPIVYGNWQGIPVYGMNLVHSGGNYMTDGQGIAVSTNLVWTENPGYTHEQINQMVEDYLGVTIYHVVTDALGASIKHIDCWAKYLAPDVIMIIEVSPGHSHYDEIEEAVMYFENQTTCYGTPYEVIRVYTHLNEPYINSLILNDKVLIPITGSQWDDEAIESYENAMPGYEILGFTGSWLSTDALHCRVMGITDRYMLYIEYTPLTGNLTSHDGYEIEAKIFPYSGEDIITSSTGIYWKTEDSNWDFIEMEPIGNDLYHAVIPQPLETDTIVYYYIHAEDESGRSENHPYIGALDAHSFTAILVNDPPEKPNKPQGPTSGTPGTECTYITSTTDPDNDQVYYKWSWDDGNISEWLGPYESGEAVIISYNWTIRGTYEIKVKARDTHRGESKWSDPLQIKIVLTKERSINPILFNLLQRFLFLAQLLKL